MNKFLIAFLVIGLMSKCGGCDDCGSAAPQTYKYGFINMLNVDLTIDVFGKEDNLKISLDEKDTSSFWEVVFLPPPGGISPTFFTVDVNTLKSFPFNSDSIQIKANDKVLRTYHVDFMSKDSNWVTSVYNDTSPPYQIEQGDESIRFTYQLDSVNLNLK